MREPVALDKPARTLGWPKSPTLLFGMAAVFFLASGNILTKTGLLSVPLPILRGQITRIPAGNLRVLTVATFAWNLATSRGQTLGYAVTTAASVQRNGVGFKLQFVGPAESIQHIGRTKRL